MLFDTHAHLYDPAFKEDLNEVIKQCQDVGVDLILLCSDTIEACKQIITLTKKYEIIYGAVGIHPCEVFNLDLNNTLKQLEEFTKENKIKAIGEIGLDYYWNKLDEEKSKQQEWFIAQIELANRLQLPVSIHSRDAIQDTINILKTYTPKYGFVMHCYSSSKEIMKEIINLGGYISLGGPVTFKNAVLPKEVAKEVPIDRLLIETDSPYLAPQNYRGKRNNPSYVIEVANQIAILKNKTLEEIERVTFENGKNLFKI